MAEGLDSPLASCHTVIVPNGETMYTILAALAFLADLIELTYDLGRFTRTHVLPALVYCYVVMERYVAPAFSIPYYYVKVRQQRLACATV